MERMTNAEIKVAPVKLGMVLSGGGARGVAHIGVLKALRDDGIHVTHFAGTSAGALVGVMAAAGCSDDEMLAFWTDSQPFRIRHLAMRATGFFEATSYVDVLKDYVKYERFEELPCRLSVAVTAMVEGKIRYFSEGPLWPIVLAAQELYELGIEAGGKSFTRHPSDRWGDRMTESTELRCKS